MSLYTVKPITDFTIFTTPDHLRKPIQFQANWPTTLKELRRELDYLDAEDCILEIGVQPGQIRLDGNLRSDAKVTHHGVRFSFQSKHGALSYTCDTYEGRWAHQMPDWQANVRAIVKTLEALRAVDRYGATKGEQYAGFKELPAGSGATARGGMTRTEAWDAIEAALGFKLTEVEQFDPDEIRAAYKRARASAHPDRRDGERDLWDKVELAGKVLGLAS